MTDFAALVAGSAEIGTRTLHVVDAAGLAAWCAGLDETARAALDAACFAGKPGDLALLPDGAVVGVPDAATLGAWDLAGAAGKLAGGTWRLASCQPGAALHGWLMAQHRFDRYRSARSATPVRTLIVDGMVRADEAVAIAGAAALARDLIDTPAADLTPDALAAAIEAEAATHGATVTVTRGETLRAGFPAVHAVGRAAAAPPCLVDVTWGDPAHPRITLVGKGVCFDSGGLNMKTGAGMALMKKDMGGAAIALALARLVMERGLAVRLRLIVPAVENAVAGNAFRPGDVIRTRHGLTVEVGNTDAEGRLILADALTLAQEDKPDLLIDMATLTGAARVALGPELPALFCNDDALAAALLESGFAAGEPLWRLPLWPGYRDNLKSPIADLGNVAEGTMAGAIVAGLFLERFVAPDQRWAHLDLYGWTPAAKPGRPRGGEATALRALWRCLNDLHRQ